MNRVYLCLGKPAEAPYYFEHARVRVWSVEELCYFIKENIWLIDPSCLTPQLCDWIGDQCGLRELAQILLDAIRADRTTEKFLDGLFSYTGYCTKQELEQAKRAWQATSGADALQRQKARGDYDLGCGRKAIDRKSFV